ncbi:MAG TPA: ATP-binding cassette domain-containing protein [Ilumatobacteraceae bacterium]|nr:ATP-binding cassette domain-containing protein [Ilumatobacteraceae bacterium]
MLAEPISLSNVGFHYRNGQWLFRGVSFEFPAGSTTAIVGPSGTGKTTLLALLDGSLRPTEGTVARDEGKRIWLFQSPSLLPRRTATENVALPMVAAGVRWGDCLTAAAAHLETVGLADVARSQARHLSGGQAQRVAVARCLAARPELLLADEPTAALDRVSASPICDSLRAVAASGATVVIATHDERLAAACDRILELAPPAF